MATKDRALAANEMERCRFIDDADAQCRNKRITNKTFCWDHQFAARAPKPEPKPEARGLVEAEDEYVGGPEIGEKLRAEALAAQLEEMRGEILRLKEAAAVSVAAISHQPSAVSAGLTADSLRLTAGAPATPFSDPETQGARRAMERQGQPVPKPGGRRKKTVAAPDMPVEVEGHAEVVRRMKEAQEKAFEQREKRSRDRKRRGLPADEGRVPIEVYLQRPLDNDYSAVVDEYGNRCTEPGYVYRHIRMYDLNPDGSRQPNPRRLHLFKRNYKAEVVKRPTYDSAGKRTGEEDWITPLGTLVRYPIDEYAQRVIDNSPYGAFDAAMDDTTASLDDMIERENSRIGVRGGVGQLVTTEGFGERSVDINQFE